MASEFNGGVKLAPVDDASRARGAAATIGRSSIVIFALILLSVGAFFRLMLAASEAGWRIGGARLAGTAGALAKGAGSAEAALVGYDTSENGARSWAHSVILAAVVSLTVYVIVDVEFPRLGLIRVDSADAVVFELLESMR